MLRFAVLFLSFFVFSHISVANAPKGGENFQKISSQLSDYIDTYREIFETPGVGVVIVKDGKVTFSKGFGTISVNDSSPLDAQTICALASGTKNFTATLIMRLVEMGKITLDDKVIKYLPDFKLASEDATNSLTIRHLLSQCVGLPGFAGDALWHGGMDQKEILEKMRLFPMDSTPGTKYAYNNIFVGIAGLIIEKVMDKSYARVLEEELLAPLGMHDTSVGIEAMIREVSLIDHIVGWVKHLFKGSHTIKRAKFHALKEGKAHEIPYFHQFYLFPGSSGVNSTMDDMGKWLMFHLNEGISGDGKVLISKNLMQEMKKDYVDATKEAQGTQFPAARMNKITMGLGWFNCHYGVGDKRTQMHLQMGGIAGARSLITLIPSENMGIFIVGNLGGMRASLFPESILFKFMDMYLGIAEDVDWAKKIREKFLKVQENIKRSYDAMRLKNPKPAVELEAYEGAFNNEMYGKIEVKAEKNHLVLHYLNARIPVEHWNGNFFKFHGNELATDYAYDEVGMVEFGLDDAGKAYGAIINFLDEGPNPTFMRE